MMLSAVVILALWGLIRAVPLDEELIEHGNAFAALGQSELAIKSYEDALTYKTDNQQASFLLAVALVQNNQLDQALAVLDSIENYPTPAHINLERGWILYQQGRYAAAAPHFRSALDTMRQTPDAYVAEDFGRANAGLGGSLYHIDGNCQNARQRLIRASELMEDLTIIQQEFDICNE